MGLFIGWGLGVLTGYLIWGIEAGKAATKLAARKLREAAERS